jgi:hypothetical protein
MAEKKVRNVFMGAFKAKIFETPEEGKHLKWVWGNRRQSQL